MRALLCCYTRAVVVSVLEPGTLVGGRFRVDRMGPRGAIAHDIELDRWVELELLSERPEGPIGYSTSHVNLQSLYSIQVDRAGHFIVVREYVPGETLSSWIALYEQRFLPIDAAVGILDPVARAVESLHADDRRHGSIDADHVVVGSAFRVCLLAPRSRNVGVCEPHHDRQALGRLAYRLLTGIDPKGLPAPASAVRPGLSRALDEPLSRMMGPTPMRAETFRQRLAVGQAFAAATPLAHTILLIDEDDTFRAQTARILQQAFPDAQFLHCRNVSEGIQTMSSRPVALVVSEMTSSSLDGFALARSMRTGRSIDDAGRVPLLMVTGSGNAMDWRGLSEVGVDAFALKPVDATSLIASARRLLGAPEPPRYVGYE